MYHPFVGSLNASQNLHDVTTPARKLLEQLLPRGRHHPWSIGGLRFPLAHRYGIVGGECYDIEL